MFKLVEETSGPEITVDKLGELFNTAYLKAATIENAVSGFKCTGIIPFNPEILPSNELLEDPVELMWNHPPPNHPVEKLGVSSTVNFYQP